MLRDTLSRRSILAIAASSAVTGAGAATITADEDAVEQVDEAETGVSRDSYPILEGTEHETTVHVTEAEADGPTVLVVGGIHGNEDAGYVAADEIAEWTIDAGTLVTIPEADANAVENGTRFGDSGVDLNRQFPQNSEPGTDLSQAIWDVVLEYDPAVVVDLHESRGIYAGDPVDGVGQAIFHSETTGAATTAQNAVEHVNSEYIDGSDPNFQTGNFSGPNAEPSGLLVHKAARDLNADTFLVESLSTNHDLETRIEWHSAIVEHTVEDGLFPSGEPDNSHEPEDDVDEEAGDSDEPDEPGDGEESDEEETSDGDSPTAEIRTDPDEAEDLSLESGQTVTLDGSCSVTPNGGIERYEWSIDSDDSYERTGETIDVTVAKDGDYSVGLRVVDDTGATGKESITLSAE